MKTTSTWVTESMTDEIRTQVGVLADLIVPRVGERPSASDVGVADRYIDVALAARPDLHAPLSKALGHLQSQTGDDPLATLEVKTLEPVAELIIACYFMAPSARRRIDYNGQNAVPIADGEAEYYLEEDDRLAIVLRRGAVWRRTQEDPGASKSNTESPVSATAPTESKE